MGATTFDHVNRQARPYPSYLLPKEGTGLSLFSAAFLGWNDGIHLVRAGLQCEFVDSDKDRLYEMASIYPGGHIFHVADGWEFAEDAAQQDRQWDVVTADPFFEDMAQKAWDSLDLWLSLATKLVTLTVHADTELSLPASWEQSYFPRGDNVGWAVIQRAA